MSPQEMVTEFHRAFDTRISEEPSLMLMIERWHLIVEEFIELLRAWLGNVPERDIERLRDWLISLLGHLSDDIFPERAEQIAKESADLVYVVFGGAVNLGIDLDIALARVHANNMAKIGADGQSYELNNLGKLIKPKNHPRPDLRDALPPWLRGEETT